MLAQALKPLSLYHCVPKPPHEPLSAPVLQEHRGFRKRVRRRHRKPSASFLRLAPYALRYPVRYATARSSRLPTWLAPGMPTTGQTLQKVSSSYGTAFWRERHQGRPRVITPHPVDAFYSETRAARPSPLSTVATSFYPPPFDDLCWTPGHQGPVRHVPFALRTDVPNGMGAGRRSRRSSAASPNGVASDGATRRPSRTTNFRTYQHACSETRDFMRTVLFGSSPRQPISGTLHPGNLRNTTACTSVPPRAKILKNLN